MKKHLALLILSIPSLMNASATNWLLYATGLLQYTSNERRANLLVQALESKNVSFASYLIKKCNVKLPVEWSENQDEGKMDELLEEAIRQDDGQIAEIALKAGACPHRTSIVKKINAIQCQHKPVITTHLNFQIPSVEDV